MKKIRVTCKEGQEGFTLLEVMISLAILAVGILGVVGMFSTSIGGNAQGRRMTEASALAQAKLTYLTNMEVYGSLANGSEAGLKSDGTSGGIYDRSWTISTPVSTLKMKRITVKVAWTSKGYTHQVEMTTLRNADK